MIVPPTWLDCHSVAKWLPSLREMEWSPRGLTSIFKSEDIYSPVGRYWNEAQEIDVHQYDIDSLDIEIYGLVIKPLELEGVVEKVTEHCGGEEGLGSRPAGDVKGVAGVSAGRGGVGDVV